MNKTLMIQNPLPLFSVFEQAAAAAAAGFHAEENNNNNGGGGNHFHILKNAKNKAAAVAAINAAMAGKERVCQSRWRDNHTPVRGIMGLMQPKGPKGTP